MTFDLHDYSEKYSEQYRDRSFETTLVAVRRQQVLRSLERYPHRRVLEIGCGLEPLFLFCDDYDSYTVVEPAEEFVAHARERAPQGRDVRVLQGFFEDVAGSLEREPAFDFVVVSSLLHEVADPQVLLAAVRRVCGAATTVHLNVPNVYSFHRLLALEMGLIDSIFEPSATETAFQRRSRYDRETLTRTVEAAGFRLVDSGTYLIKPFTHAQMEALLRQGIVAPEVIGGLERMAKYLPDMGCEIFVDLRIA